MHAGGPILTYTHLTPRAGIYPFFIASHTSAWAQPNDCGLNALYKSKFFAAVKRWRRDNPFAPYDRSAFNECVVEAIKACEIKLATDLATSKAKMTAWVEAGSPPQLKPKGKCGNAITRMYAKTGWWPLKCNSILWEQAIDTLGAACKPRDHRVGQKLQPLADFGNDKSLKIRQLVLKGFNEHFLNKAHRAEEAAQKRSKRRSKSRSAKNTALGRGLTKEEDLAIIDADAKKKAEDKKMKEQKQAAAARKKTVTHLQQLEEARSVLRRYQRNKDLCSKKLLVCHLKALLVSMGKGKDIKGLKKGPLLEMYWSVHQPVPTSNDGT